ncbi:hypothetical protein ACFOSS_08385 [Pseudaeromonas sharmana]|uniref:Uncharacterized protein n=1 Tax=Pseudaeromonas sharmana TaxID=328412 RepID=A0ABV8CMN1_9GAMM
MNRLPSTRMLEQLCDEVPALYRLDLPDMPSNTAILRMMRHMPSRLALQLQGEPEQLARLASGVPVPLEELNDNTLTVSLNDCLIGQVALTQQDGQLCLQVQDLLDQQLVSALFN